MPDNLFSRAPVTFSDLPVGLDDVQPRQGQGLLGWPITEMHQLSSNFPTQVADHFSNPSAQGTNHDDSSGYVFDNPGWSSHAPFQNTPPDLSLVGAGHLGQEAQVAEGNIGA